jgi:ABC-type antimicrobial peptide transport system permease subunit
MIRNYLKIAFRNLGRNKAFSFINILGLAIGMASAMLILIWIQHEVSYDRFHEKQDRIYEAWNRNVFSGKLQSWNTTPKVLASALQRDNPEIETTARVNWSTSRLLKVGEKSFLEQGNVVDSTFLNIFSFPLVKGNSATALMDPAAILITETLAEKLFGKDDPMGKIIMMDVTNPVTVTGVLKDLPKNSRFNFNFLMPWARLRAEGQDETFWGNNSVITYALVKPNINFSSLEARVKEMRRKYDTNEKNGEFFLYPMKKWHLYSRFEEGKETGGFIEFVRLFGMIAGFILLIACINFMNLSTARSERRAREVGIRKVVGARRSSLIGQFLGESTLIALISGVLALLIVQFVLPSFSQLTGRNVDVQYGHPLFWVFFLGFILFTGLLAGSYPAFFLSSFRPVSVLKGTFRKVNALISPRKVLVVLQFTFAIILIISTLVVKKQIDHARDREPGYNRAQLVYTFTSEDIQKNYMLIKNELLSSGVAESVTKTSAPMTEGWSNTWGIEWPGKDPNDRTIVDIYCADDKIAKTVGLQLVMGRDLDLNTFATDSSAMLINESALKLMKLKDPLGATLRMNDRDWRVVGVFKDFILQSPYRPTTPMVVMGAHGWFSAIHIRLNSARSTRESISKMEAIYRKYNPHYPFDYKFIDAEYEAKFKSEQRAGTLAGVFAGLTIFISCLGLLGLAAYMAENRIKEIGVRKVLGASVTDITTLLSKDFLKLVLVSFIIASPVAWWAMNTWLKDYEYRINVPVSSFVIAGTLSLLIALLTVSSQAVKAAVSNPVKSLRTE